MHRRSMAIAIPVASAVAIAMAVVMAFGGCPGVLDLRCLQQSGIPKCRRRKLRHLAG